MIFLLWRASVVCCSFCPYSSEQESNPQHEVWKFQGRKGEEMRFLLYERKASQIDGSGSFIKSMSYEDLLHV